MEWQGWRRNGTDFADTRFCVRYRIAHLGTTARHRHKSQMTGASVLAQGNACVSIVCDLDGVRCHEGRQAPVIETAQSSKLDCKKQSHAYQYELAGFTTHHEEFFD